MAAQKVSTDTVVRAVREDITQVDADAFVYHAQGDLVLGTGFGNAIAQRGGPSIQAELNELGPCQTCDAVITKAGNLKASHIIHAVGPRFREANIEEKVRRTIANAMKVAEENGVRTLAVPALGRGFYGVPLPVSAKNTVAGVLNYLRQVRSGLSEVLICVNDRNELDAVEAEIARSGPQEER